MMCDMKIKTWPPALTRSIRVERAGLRFVGSYALAFLTLKFGRVPPLCHIMAASFNVVVFSLASLSAVDLEDG